jgi:putative acyl-CoA dehydrogenase
MPIPSLPSLHATHEVLNQPPPFTGRNRFAVDRALQEALHREGAGWAEAEVSAFGALVGSEEVIEWGFLANNNPPVLHTHDRWGNRRDEVEYHPAWHALVKLAVEHGLHSMPWAAPRVGAHVARAALFLLAAENEYGHLCPVSMTYAVLPALRKQADVAADWEPRILTRKYDPRFAPAGEKTGVLCGMAMTEKQGGSDVRANTSRAAPIGAGGPGGEYLITGHKWFCSAPMCDAFLVLAQTAKGLSCFLLPRFTPDGLKNRFFVQRLKDKLGNRSNASSEIELSGAWARMVGEDGRGVPTIIEMANHTRLDCALSSAGMMRQALHQALHHTEHRSAFGRRLLDQPLMRNVLTDLCLESEAAIALTMRLARAYDRQASDETEAAFRRLMTAASKYWVCKRAPAFVMEALECLGGAGYVEESILPRLYREVPLNSIWEGSGNVMCLDVLRALSKDPRALPAVLGEIKLAAGADRRFDAFVATFEAEDATRLDGMELYARRFVERLVLALQGSLLLRFAPPAVADGFCASRLGGAAGGSTGAFGTLPAGVDLAAILDRSRPQ